MSTDWRAQRLPCGAELSALLEQVADDRGEQRSAHQRSCPYCRVALDEAGRSWAPVRELAADDVDPPEGLVRSIMRQVHRLAQAGWLTLRRTARGVTCVSGWVVAAIAEAAADDTPGVHRVGTSFGRLIDTVRAIVPAGEGERTASGGKAYEVAEHQAGVDIEVVTVYGARIPDVGEAVRRNVIARVESLTGLDVAEVNVEVTDVKGGGRQGAPAG